MKKESRKMADEAVKEYNKILNLLDPPKDMNDGYTTGTIHRTIPDAANDTLKTYLIELFWPGYNTATKKPTLPTGFKPVGDTKKTIQQQLGSETITGKGLSAYIAEKANRLRILRETHSTGEDGRPSGLFIAQDSGPGVEKLVKGGHIIITPGTIMDPASKTKAAAAGDDFDVTNFVTLGKYTSLPPAYIENLNMNNIITGGNISMSNAAPNYHVTIPYNFGDDSGTIDAYLKHTDFKKATDVGSNDDGNYFLGNDTKNSYISSNYSDNAKKNTIKKYILVKELGDTLQVSWLKYIMKTSDDAKTALDGAGNAPSAVIRTAASNNPYTSDKTAIITGDTVVWYRSMVNKVPVFLTWKGETNFWRASDNDAFMVAAMKKTIREQLISDNQAVIDIIKEVANSPYTPTGTTGKWITDVGTWTPTIYTSAKTYLLELAKKLENLNKDGLIFIDNVVDIDNTKDAAKKYHFNNPFVKKSGVWKPNDKVLSILPDNNVKFYAKGFKEPSSLIAKLNNENFFHKIQNPNAAQWGGARKTITQKKREAKDAIDETLQKKYITDRIDEFAQADDVDIEAEYSGEWNVITTRAEAAKRKRNTPTSVHDSVTKIKDWDIFSLSSDGATPLKPNDNVLYLFVRDFFPEVFTYAAMMKQAFDDLKTETYTPGGDTTASRAAARDKRAAYAAMSAAFPNISLGLKTQYPLEYTFNEMGQMNVEGSVPGTPDATLKATKQALYLAHKFITYYDFMPSKDLLTFVNYCVLGNHRILSADEKTAFDTALAPMTANNYAYAEYLLHNQGGGGNEKVIFDPILSSAMDNYELYYSLYVQASYEDRTVTDAEFQRALIKNKGEMALLEMKSARAKQPKTMGISAQNLSKLVMKTGPSPKNLALERLLPNGLVSNYRPMYVNTGPPLLMGGKSKSKYRKTHKRRKSSRKLKTRRQKRV